MSTPSLIVAIQTKFATLTAGNFPGGVVPALYFDEAPQTSATGAQIQVTTAGYVVLKDQGSSSRGLAFGGPTREVVKFDFEFFYPSLGDCRAAALATSLNGGLQADKLGFDFGDLPDLGAPYTLLAIRPRSNKAVKAGVGKTGVPVHQWTLGYDVEVYR